MLDPREGIRNGAGRSGVFGGDLEDQVELVSRFRMERGGRAWAVDLSEALEEEGVLVAGEVRWLRLAGRFRKRVYLGSLVIYVSVIVLMKRWKSTIVFDPDWI
jgi:hypothetical protein